MDNHNTAGVDLDKLARYTPKSAYGGPVMAEDGDGDWLSLEEVEAHFARRAEQRQEHGSLADNVRIEQTDPGRWVVCVENWFHDEDSARAACRKWKAAYAATPPVKAMVDRFLGWKLPHDFYPDAGISFDRMYADKWGMPSGTNLFHAGQAQAMFEYVLAAPAAQQAGAADRLISDGKGGWIPTEFVDEVRGSSVPLSFDDESRRIEMMKQLISEAERQLGATPAATTASAREEWITCPACKGAHGGVGPDGVENDCPRCDNGMVRAVAPGRAPAPSREAAPDMRDAYVGAREDLAIWKKRALEAEESCRRLTAALNAENGPTFMGEPALVNSGASHAPVAAWMTEDGQRVVAAHTMNGARRDGGAMLSSMKPYSVALVRAAHASNAGEDTNMVNRYAEAWGKSFLADNPYNSTPEFGEEERRWIKAGLDAAIAASAEQEKKS